ncbi:hypothetical protein PENSOL_c007G05390 [Penicillium solitum]|uniref:Uncharacterized protein n=1 Tax=Penicillium solitum TaxID=60172 RepID=A0A1V6RCM0_9EURO|nr:uncharacterized protein PENSOL_c007G05390 [Penicillium solitum]OQD99294.1 hypothetical protein PENSOL_c007G05390 [Penicillium solitum]
MARNDLEYLHDEIESSLQRIPDVCRDIREQLDFVQIRRTNILGILAGLYLPLAFVTSFLGMNLEQYTQLQPSWRNVTKIDPTNPDNITISHSEIVDSGANQAWSLELFFEIAVPLMVGTILIPLVIGSIIRAFLRAIGRGRTWWRFIVASLVVWSVTITLKSFSASIANGRCRSYCTLSSLYAPYFTAGPLMFIPFYLFILLNLTMSIQGKKKNWASLIYWYMNTCFMAVVTLSPVDDKGAAIMGAIYGISLFVAWWLKPDLYYRWDQGRRQKSKES